MSFGGGSQSAQTYFLSRCDAQGAEQKVLLQKENVIDYADLRLDEAGRGLRLGPLGGRAGRPRLRRAGAQRLRHHGSMPPTAARNA